jgi:arylsulfatase A-like enzyme
MTQQPNVVVFLTDQQRFDTLGVHGNPLGLTPNIDRMAQHGTHFENAFTPNPVCAPARSSLQTGLMPTATGVYVNGIPLAAESTTIAEAFNDAGYQTGYIGKWHLAPSDPVTEEHRAGYTSWLGANILEFSSDEYRTIVWDEECEPVMLPGYRADGLTDAIIRFIADNHDKPFMLFSSFIEPHHQNEHDNYPAPDGYAEQYTGRWTPPDLEALGGTSAEHLGGYYGQVKRLDECIGRINDALKSMGLLEDTIVIVTSDHGSHFKTRNNEYKRSCHEASIRVPFVVNGGPFTAGGRHPELVSTVDLPATLFEIAGVDPGELHGRSLLPLVNRDDTGEPWRDSVLVQISESQVGRALRTDRWKYAVVAPEATGTEVASAEVYEEDALYDLQADPYELHNLIHAEPFEAVLADLRRALIEQIKSLEGVDATIREVPRTPSMRSPETKSRSNPIEPARFGHQPRPPLE